MKSKFKIIFEKQFFIMTNLLGKIHVWYLSPRFITWNIKCECDGDMSDYDVKLIGDNFSTYKFQLNFSILCLYFVHTCSSKLEGKYDKFTVKKENEICISFIFCI